ncbi:MAG TPA: TetR/AcrR family transcriptional regulator [Phototrophicaceae bacterium]|nr:TetR/AcrR family transcriptional regulator [Phototrophicaceae bacterium]
MGSENRMRRTPQQARGQRRVSKILDAAAEVFAEIGYEAATTNAIAIRANTSIGSLYQFFPNKFAILNALAKRYQVKLNSFLGEAHESDLDTLQAHLSRLIDRTAEYYAANPAFQPMFYASQSSQALEIVAKETGHLLESRVRHIFAKTHPALSSEQRDFYAVFVVFLLRALIPLCKSDDAIIREHVQGQIKRMMFAYLASIEAFRDQPFTLEDE